MDLASVKLLASNAERACRVRSSALAQAYGAICFAPAFSASPSACSAVFLAASASVWAAETNGACRSALAYSSAAFAHANWARAKSPRLKWAAASLESLCALPHSLGTLSRASACSAACMAESAFIRTSMHCARRTSNAWISLQRENHVSYAEIDSAYDP